jgi:four helix bundle protein
MFNFENLDTWHHAIDFADSIYSLTSDFPRSETFGLTSQMRRAAVSVSANIAEGSSRSSRDDFARFVEMGTGSLFEVVSHAFIAHKRLFLASEAFQKIYSDAERQSRMMSGLRNSLRGS